MANNVTIYGLPALMAQLQRLPQVVFQGTQVAMEDTLDQMAEDTEDIALMKGVYDTGELVGSITTEVSGDESNYTGEVIVDVEHAVYNELGWGMMGAMTVGGLDPSITPVYTTSLKGFPARPFVTPAYFLNKDKGIETFEEKINESINSNL